MIVRVVDTETTGLGGWTHGDHVVDVDVAGMDGPQAHRALSDAVQAAHVLLRLVDRGIYPRELPEATA